MITAEKLKIYRRFGGDGDGWVRMGTRREKKIMTDQDWAEIDQLFQRLRIEKSGVAADNYIMETERMIAEYVENVRVANEMRECA